MFIETILEFLRNQKAKTNVAGIVILAVSAMIGAAILPATLTMVAGVNQTGWDAGAVALWGLVSIMIVMGYVIGIIAGALALLGKL